MSNVTKFAKLIFQHRKEIQTAYDKNGIDYRAHAKDASDFGYNVGTKAATAPLRAWENIPRLIVRGLQFLFGIIIVGIYGVRVGAGQKDAADASPAWWFGLMIAVLSCLSAIILAFTAPLGAISKRFKTHHLFGWDLTFFLLWIVVFGIFMGIFHNRSSDDPYKGSSTALEKSAAWLDFVNALLWLVSGAYGGIKTWVGRRRDALKNQAQTRLLYGGRPGQNPGNVGKEEMSMYSHDSDLAEPEPVYEPQYQQNRGFVFSR